MTEKSRQDGLEEYREQRDLEGSPEPAGGEPPGESPIFVVQKHDASRLHYDFRIEVGGVLKSWAIPKGPSMMTRNRRLAVPTEDHPMDYAGFEGTIPEDEYGGGTVMVWDRGEYRNISQKNGEIIPVSDALDKGHVSVSLEGKKLTGGFSLVRTGKGSDARWLLIKMSDGQANPDSDPVQSKPKSVLTGRTLEEIEEEGG